MSSLDAESSKAISENDGQKVFTGFGPVFISDEFDQFKCDKGE